MKRVIIHERPDGGVTTYVRVRPLRPGETEEDYQAAFAARIERERGGRCHLATEADLPAGRRFREAWKARDGKAEVDMPRARAIHLERLRAARDRVLASSDGPYLRAVEADDRAAIATFKRARQKLRDLPADLAADLERAATPDQLDAIWPAELGTREG